jgi:asparaginyl-tRNA synthetase
MTHALGYLTTEFAGKGFDWLLPVMFSKSTDPLWPDPCASIEKRVAIEIYGETVRPTASMIVHKMVACSLVSPRIFILSPNARIEKGERATTGLHAYEFTQLDFEMRDTTSADVKGFVEETLCGLISRLKTEMKTELLDLERYDDLSIPRYPFKAYDRSDLEQEYGKTWEPQIIKKIRDPAWVTNIPREFYDFEDGRSGEWDNYDLYLPQYGEVLSGARREFEWNKIIKKMGRDGVKEKEFKLLLNLARDGRLKPSAGAGIGVERLVSWIVGARHIGETQFFPKIPGRVYDL